jgi:hypothetical protein
MSGAMTPLPQYDFMAWWFKNTDFTLLLLLLLLLLCLIIV